LPRRSTDNDFTLSHSRSHSQPRLHLATQSPHLQKQSMGSCPYAQVYLNRNIASSSSPSPSSSWSCANQLPISLPLSTIDFQGILTPSALSRHPSSSSPLFWQSPLDSIRLLVGDAASLCTSAIHAARGSRRVGQGTHGRVVGVGKAVVLHALLRRLLLEHLCERNQQTRNGCPAINHHQAAYGGCGGGSCAVPWKSHTPKSLSFA
jgi:hypothetical protein